MKNYFTLFPEDDILIKNIDNLEKYLVFLTLLKFSVKQLSVTNAANMWVKQLSVTNAANMWGVDWGFHCDFNVLISVLMS